MDVNLRGSRLCYGNLRPEKFPDDDAAKQTSHTGKLDPKWKGPFYIHDQPYQGVYKLRTMDGKVLKAPINGSLLKMYHNRSAWVSQVVIV